MPTGQPANTSGTARLMTGGPSYAVGWQETVAVPNPPAGAGWSHTVDGRYYERLIGACWVLATDAVAGGRYPALQLTDNNGRLVYQATLYNNYAASTELTFSAFVGNAAQVQFSAVDVNNWLPDLLIPPGWTWRSNANGYDPGDQESAVTLLVQRFPNDVAAISAGD